MSANCYTLALNVDFTLCIEILNTNYQLWHKSKVSVDKTSSQGLTIENVSVRKFTHRYTDSKNQTQFMYYHRMIINFRNTAPAHPYFLHILVDIPQVGNDLGVYPKNFTWVYIIAYGVLGRVSDVDADKVYDYHTAFNIKPTEVSFNVDINANQKAIRNIKLKRNSNNSAAAVAMVKELTPFTKNALYREYFEQIYDFSDATNYNLTLGVSGVVFTGIKPNLSFKTSKDLSIVNTDGLRLQYKYFDVVIPNKPNFTICLVMKLCLNRNFKILFTINSVSTKVLSFNKSTKELSLIRNAGTTKFSIPDLFNGKKIVLWMAENSSANVIKASISNYSVTLTQNSHTFSGVRNKFKLDAEDGMFCKLMYSSKFYDFDSEQYHRVLLQEKLNGAYVV